MSNFGNIKSYFAWNGSDVYERELILTPIKQKVGNYERYKIALSKNKKQKQYMIHRLVAQAFIPNPDNKPQINHIDNNALNNNVNNLEWCTSQENITHSILYGGNNRDKLKETIVSEFKSGLSPKQIAIRNKTAHPFIIKTLKENGLKNKPRGYFNTKYKIDKGELLNMFKQGKSNKDIAKHYDIRNDIIAKFRYDFKKEGLLSIR